MGTVRFFLFGAAILVWLAAMLWALNIASRLQELNPTRSLYQIFGVVTNPLYAAIRFNLRYSDLKNADCVIALDTLRRFRRRYVTIFGTLMAMFVLTTIIFR